MNKIFLKIVMLLCCVFMFSMSVQATTFDEDYAQKLKLLGVFQGTDAGFELEREPTRLEGLIVMLRLLGEEKNALNYKVEHDFFEDVPEWGKPYVYYAYSKGITKGVSSTSFAPNTTIQSFAFLTYVLRAMDYLEGTDSNADFVWNEPESFALYKNIVNEEQLASWSRYPFVRRDIVRIAYSSLNANKKDGEQLAEALIKKGVFTRENAKIAEIALKEEKKDANSPISIGTISKIEPILPETPQKPSHPSEKPEDVKPEFPDEKPYSLVGQATSTKYQVYQWAKSKGMPQEGLDLVDVYFEICERKGLNPVIQYAQMCHETGFLYIRGSLAGMDASYHNPCGLKVTEGGDGFKAESHKRFVDWREGIEAHTDHTALYAGVSGYPKQDTPDPRHFNFLMGKATMLADLSGKWAPSWYYHRKIYAMLQQIEAVQDVVSK